MLSDKDGMKTEDPVGAVLDAPSRGRLPDTAAASSGNDTAS